MFSSQKTIVSIDLKGMIASGGRAPLNIDNLNALFGKLRKMKFDALSIVVNSPGGSPVQSSLIAQKIREICIKKKIKCYCFVEDVAASGGYWLACSADEIYADINSIVGSIGVISGVPWVHLPITMGYDRYPELLIDEKKQLYEEVDLESNLLFFTHDINHSAAVISKNEKGKYHCVEKIDSFNNYEL